MDTGEGQGPQRCVSGAGRWAHAAWVLVAQRLESWVLQDPRYHPPFIVPRAPEGRGGRGVGSSRESQ